MATNGFNILGGGDSLLDTPAPPATPPAAAVDPASLRAFGDVDTTRRAIYDRVFDAAKNLPPVSNKTHTLSLTNVAWADPDHRTKRERKEAVLGGHTLGRRLKGTWELTDNATGNVLDRREQVVLHAPHLTEGGTFVHNGNEYALKNQQRLLPGVYTRRMDSGELESHVNVTEGGPSHRIRLDPAKGVFYVHAGNADIPLLPLLRHLGASESDLRDAWGDDLYARNYAKGDGAAATTKLLAKFVRNPQPDAKPHEALQAAFEKMKLDPEVTRRTLGHPYDRFGKDALLATTRKLLAVNRGEAKVDDRDHLAFQHFLGPEDLFAERLTKDRAGVRRQLLFKASGKGHLRSMPSSALQGQVDSALLESGLGQSLEEINAAEILDKNTQISRMGEGGIPSIDSIPSEARAVQPSHYGFLDPLRTPESLAAGVDLYLSNNARKGPDGRLYARFKDPRNGQFHWKTPRDVADAVVTFPGALQQPGKRAWVMRGGRLTTARKRDVSLVLPAMEHAFSPLNNLIPLKSMLKGQRSSMASRMSTQALSLIEPEAPLVQNAVPGSSGSRSYEEEYGRHLGAIKADRGGRVISAKPGAMTVRYDDGRLATVELYDNHPYNRKSYIHQTPVVAPGQRFGPGQLLARSNFTDKTGAAALGLNARVAYLSWGGKNYEDAIVVSESMARRLSSEHAYQHQLEPSERTKTGRRTYLGLFPGKYTRAQLTSVDNEGVVQPGTKVNFGDPLILAAEERDDAENKVHRKGQPGYNDASVTWEHHDPGVVTDVVRGKHGPVVLVKSVHPTQIGDKLSGRHGNKGVVSAIIPDHQMPADKSGQPFEVLMNPLGVISRGNPSSRAEAKLGEIAHRLGHPVKVEDFDPSVPDRTEWVLKQMAAHGVPDTEDLIDPATGATIPGVATGRSFIMKLHHTAEGKSQGRGGGAYSSDETPSKGGAAGSKRIAIMDLNALLSHGATDVLRDAGAIRGQRNEDYWLQFMQGHTPRQPKVPLVYEKFVNNLKASGINVVRDGSQLNIMALTDKDVDHLAGDREIASGDTVKFGDKLEPVEGGLFDPRLTGGHHGNRWSAVKLHEPMLSPVMEEPARRILGLTQKKLESVIAGREPLPKGGGTGPAAIAEALKQINVDREIAAARHQVKFGSRSARDDAVRRLGYLKSAKRLGVHPGDWVLSRVPVLPPQFRPVSLLAGGKGVPLVADANYLYKELIEANRNLKDMKGAVGEEGVGDERLALYHAFKAVTGLGDPVTQQNQDRQVRGILAGVFGSSPKFGSVNRKLLSSTVDNVGRGVIVPDPDLDMDQVGLPEDRAFDVYERFVVRRLRRQGMAVTDALKQVRDRTPLARNMLVEEMDHRPVIVNRAPVLHRFGIMAFRPQLTKGSVLRVPPLITKGFGADFDGNCLVYHAVIVIEIDQAVLYDAPLEQKEPYMRLVETAAVEVVRDGVVRAVIPIGEFPHGEDFVTDRNGAKVYSVPAGVRVLTWSPKTGQPAYCPVTGFTIEEDCACVRVTTRHGRSVEVSDNESLAVIDPETGELVKVTPKDAVGRLVPFVAESPQRRGGGKFDFATGWWYGALVSDGWVTERTVGYSKNDPVKRQEFVRLACDLFGSETFTPHEYIEDKKDNASKYGDSAKVHLNGTALCAKIFSVYADVRGEGRGALYKRLPAELLSRGSRECLLGLLSGLLDGDAFVAWPANRARSKPQFTARVLTSSAALRDDVKYLCRLLGMRYSVTISPANAARAEAYTIVLCTADVHRLGPQLKLVGEAARAALVKLCAGPKPKDDVDIVPVTPAVAGELAASLLAAHAMTGYGGLRLAVNRGHVSRDLAMRAVAECPSPSLAVRDWLKRVVEVKTVRWDVYTEVEPLPRQTVYDLVVPDTKVYATDDGLIIYDTMQYHVPASEEARVEALERMLPSRQLLSPADFKTPVHAPTQEYTGGLFQATTHRTKRGTRTFRNAADVRRAWERGDIDLGDAVEVLEEGKSGGKR